MQPMFPSCRNQLISCKADQLTGFYMAWWLAGNGLNISSDSQLFYKNAALKNFAKFAGIFYADLFSKNADCKY